MSEKEQEKPLTHQETVEKARVDQMIAAYLDGDETAFDRIVDLSKHRGFALALRMTRDHEEALDILQEAYIRLLRHLAKWDYSCHINTWMYRVITNLCIDWHRRRRVRQRVRHDGNCQADDLPKPRPAPHPGARMAHRELIDELEAAIRRLPERMQMCFRLRYLDGLPLRGVAQAMGCSVGAVKATLFQAVRRVRAGVM